MGFGSFGGSFENEGGGLVMDFYVPIIEYWLGFSGGEALFVFLLLLFALFSFLSLALFCLFYFPDEIRLPPP